MENPIPRQLDELFALAENAAEGLAEYESAIGVKHSTQGEVRGDLAAARSAQNVFLSAKSARLASTRAQEGADLAAVTFILQARNWLKQFLGQSYSQAWDQVGFKHHSLAVPTRLNKRMELLKSLAAYLQCHPQYEIAATNLSHQHATTLHGHLCQVASELSLAWTHQRSKRVLRDAAVMTLIMRLRNLKKELSSLMPNADSRWLAFGFHIPADNSLPGTPAGLAVESAGLGHLVATWEAAPRALRYQVFKQVVGVDADFVLARTVTDLDVNLNSFTPGAHVRVRVAAVNTIGHSAPTPPIEQVVS